MSFGLPKHTSSNNKISFGPGTSQKGLPALLSEEYFESEPEQNGIESARVKKMFNAVDSDVVFYQKMSEVYKTASTAYRSNMENERKQKAERQAAIAAGLIIEDEIISQNKSRVGDTVEPVDTMVNSSSKGGARKGIVKPTTVSLSSKHQRVATASNFKTTPNLTTHQS